jgi:hypothetical protein
MTALVVMRQGVWEGGGGSWETSWAAADIQTEGTSHHKSRLGGFWADSAKGEL